MVSLFTASVTWGQWWSENIKRKIPEITNSLSFTLCTVLSSMMKSHPIPPGSSIFTLYSSPPWSLSSLLSYQIGYQRKRGGDGGGIKRESTFT